MLVDGIQKTLVYSLPNLIKIYIAHILNVASQSVEQAVGRCSDYFFLYLVLSDLRAVVVIEVVPIFVEVVLSVSRVVAATRVSIVVAHSETIVDHTLPFFRTQHIRAHIKAFKGEPDHRIQLLSASAHHGHVATRRLRLLEALKSDDHHARQSVQFHSLGRVNVLLTLVAVPHVVIVERLLLLEFAQAVFQCHIVARLLVWRVSFGFRHFTSLRHEVKQVLGD